MPPRPPSHPRSFTAVQLITVSAVVAGAVLAVVALVGDVSPALTVAGQVALAAIAVAGAVNTGRGYAEMRRELVLRAHAEAVARAEALTDELTGAYNRRGFKTLAEHHLRIARRTGGDVLVLYADVNAFKSINDRFGHAQGDATLREVAALLKRTVRESDVVARMGGDEFAVLVVEGGADAERAVRARLESALAALNAYPERRYPVSLSIGFARLDTDRSAGLGDLLHAADAALYRDKTAGNASDAGATRGPGGRRRASAA
jgi:diguanylate cyclase (GGDEF)-like protein